MSETPGRYYARQLWSSLAEDFLVSRQISTYAAAKFGLGYVGEPLDSHDRYIGCLVIPYWDGQGRERTVRFRRLDGREPKYLGLGGVPHHLFGVRMTDNARVYITEGELDAITIWQLNHRDFNAVAVPGATGWKPEWAWLFRGCEEVVLAIDNDGTWNEREQRGAKGRLLVARVGRSLQRIVPNIRVAALPPGMDVNDVYRAEGPDGLMKRLAA